MDLATLGLAVVSDPVVQATRDLDSFTAAAKRSDGASAALGATTRTASAEMRASLSAIAGTTEALNRSVIGLTAAVDRQTAAYRGSEQASTALSASTARVGAEMSATAAQVAALTAAATTSAQAMRDAAQAQATWAGAPRPNPAAGPWGAPAQAPRSGSGVPLIPQAAAPSAGAAVGPTGVPQWLLSQYAIQGGDVVQSLALGAPALMVALQQGPQILGLWRQSGVSVRDTFRTIGSSIAGILTPTRLVTGGVLAIGAAAVGAYVAWEAANERLARSLDGVGRASGATVADLQRVARAGAEANGLGLSTNRGLAAGYAGTGRIGPAMIEDLLGQTRSFARVAGVDAEEAGAALAKAFADPAKGADALNERLGFLDDSTRQLIRTMAAQGDTVGAQRELFNALSNDLSGAADRTWSLARAWDGLKAAVGGAVDAVGGGIAGAVNGPSLEDRLAALMQQRYNPTAGASRAMTIAGTDVADATIARLQDELERQERRESYAGRAVRANQASTVAGDLTRQILGTQTQQDLIDRAARLRDALETPGAADRLGAGLDDAARALDAAENAASTYISTDERFRASHDLTIRAIEARTVAEKAAIATAQTRIALAGQSVTAADAQARAEAAAAEVVARAEREAEDRRRSAMDSAALAGLPSYQRSRAEIEQRARRAAEEAQGSSGALAAIGATRQAELDALDRTTGAGLTSPQAINERIAAVRLLGQTFGRTAGEIARAEEMQSRLNAAARDGVPVTTDLRGEFERLANAAGEAAQAQEDLVKAQGKVVAGMDDLRSTSASVLASLARREDPSQMLLNKAIDFASQRFSEGLLGEAGKPGGGLFGDQVGGLIGQLVGLPAAEARAAGLQPITATTAMITATSVVVNGGVTGSGPGFGAVSVKDLPPLSPDQAVQAMAGGGNALPAAVEANRALVDQYARQYGVPTDLALAVMAAESRGNQSARSPVGAIGAMQLMPGTARDLGVDPYDPTQNIEGGVRYLAQQYNRFGGDQNRTLAAYNWGPARAATWNGDPATLPAETQGYLGAVGGYMPTQEASQAGQALSSLANQAGQSTNALGGFGQGIMGVLQMLQGNPQGATNLFAGIGNMFSGLFPGAGAGTVPLPLPKPVMGAMAGGGTAGRGGLYLVGEAGPEIAQLPAQTSVVPNHDIGRFLGGGAAAGGSRMNVQIIDQRRGGEKISQERTIGPDGEEMLRVIVRDENARSNNTGGMNEKFVSSRGGKPPMRRSAA